LQDRFWYWHGASGQKYIHSVYDPENCPPLPGAIYVAVRRKGRMRIALSVGRFTPFWDGTMMSTEAAHVARLGADEIHVHLLARSAIAAEDILADLRDAMLGEMADRPAHGLHEEAAPYRFAPSFGSGFSSAFRAAPAGESAAAA
jgi:glycosyltransferase involved in cell wall biosynthesis